MSDAISVVIERCKGQMPDVLLGEHYGYYRHDDVDRLTSLVQAIAKSEVTHDEIVALQVAILHGGPLKNADKLMASRTLGVLGSILEDARV